MMRSRSLTTRKRTKQNGQDSEELRIYQGRQQSPLKVKLRLNPLEKSRHQVRLLTILQNDVN